MDHGVVHFDAGGEAIDEEAADLLLQYLNELAVGDEVGFLAKDGGWGISYERNFGNVTFNVIQNPPNYAVVVLTGSANSPIPVTSSNTGPLAGSSGSGASAIRMM